MSLADKVLLQFGEAVTLSDRSPDRINPFIKASVEKQGFKVVDFKWYGRAKSAVTLLSNGKALVVEVSNNGKTATVKYVADVGKKTLPRTFTGLGELTGIEATNMKDVFKEFTISSPITSVKDFKATGIKDGPNGEKIVVGVSTPATGISVDLSDLNLKPSYQNSPGSFGSVYDAIQHAMIRTGNYGQKLRYDSQTKILRYIGDDSKPKFIFNRFFGIVHLDSQGLRKTKNGFKGALSAKGVKELEARLDELPYS